MQRFVHTLPFAAGAVTLHFLHDPGLGEPGGLDEIKQNLPLQVAHVARRV